MKLKKPTHNLIADIFAFQLYYKSNKFDNIFITGLLISADIYLHYKISFRALAQHEI